KVAPVIRVPMDGGVRELAIVEEGRTESTFADPSNPQKRITWHGSWRTLQPAYKFNPHWGNFAEVWKAVNIPLLLRNTFAIAMLGAVGTVVASTVVAYG